jgi:hypothetical protein
MAETYVSLKENIKIMETLHGFLPEVYKKNWLQMKKKKTADTDSPAGAGKQPFT